jgi:hypothetical protein
MFFASLWKYADVEHDPRINLLTDYSHCDGNA